jgi:hypothetical protein
MDTALCNGHHINEITRCMQLRRNDFIGFHSLHALPTGLVEHQEQAVILQSVLDILPGSREQLILMDLETHFHALPDGLLVPPSVTRRVIRILPPVHRSQILLLNGLLDYCELHGDHCTIFKNQQLWHLQDRTLHDLPHGTYVRVLVPPPADPLLNTERAIAISRDFALEAHRQHYRPECRARSHTEIHQGDTSALFQLELFMNFQQESCSQDLSVHKQLKIAPEHVSQPALQGSTSGNGLPARPPRPLTRFHGRDFDTLLNLFQSHSLIECEEEGQIAYVDTWYIHHQQHPRCSDPRAVKIYQDPASWLEDLISPWNDIIDEEADIMLYLVRPTPPCTMMECLLAHIIIEQAPRPEVVVGLITTHDAGSRGLQIDHTAWSLSHIMNSNSVLRLASVQDECRSRRCSVRRGEIPFGLFDFDEVEPGSNLVIYIQPSSQRPSWDRNVPEYDTIDLIQTSIGSPQEGLDVTSTGTNSGRNEHFAFNPAASRFCPGRPHHQTHPIRVQELHDLWTHSAFTWEGEETQITVSTWFVDQFNTALQVCWQSRNVRLHEDAQTWESSLRRAWSDRQLPGAPILIHVVQPPPPIGDRQIAAHVLIIQNPQDEVSSCLVTVFDTERTLQGHSLQFANTKNVQLALEDLVTDLGLTQRCLSPDAPSICAAWIGPTILLPGRPIWTMDGAGIIFQVSRRPTAQDLQAHFGGVNLLQTTARRLEGMRRRLTHGQVAYTHGPSLLITSPLEDKVPIRLVRADGEVGVLPSFLEVISPPSVSSIQQELQCFGIRGRIALLSDGFTALVWSVALPQDQQGNHFVYVSQKDPQDVSLHSFEANKTVGELDHMRHLYLLGFEKAVILSTNHHEAGITEVVFTESRGALQTPAATSKSLPEWPAHQPRVSHQQMFQPTVSDHNALCNLSCGVGIEELQGFFTSSIGTLCTCFEGLDLPEICSQHFATLAKHSFFDRLIIYTDGSSQTRHKHVAPELNEEIGIPDAWCFLVLGETYTSASSSDLTLIGWSAHQVRCGSDQKWSLGAERTGSAISEREALTWAMLWRIGQNYWTELQYTNHLQERFDVSTSAVAGHHWIGDL